MQFDISDIDPNFCTHLVYALIAILDYNADIIHRGQYNDLWQYMAGFKRLIHD